MVKKKNKKSKKINRKYLVAGVVLIFLAAGFLLGGKARGIVSSKLIAKGNFYFNGGEYDLDKAAKFYKAAAFVGGKTSYPHYQLARVDFMKTDYKNGLKEIDKALALDPENKRAFYIRGLIDGYAGNLDAAAEDFQKFISWAPKEWAGYNDLAWVYYQKKDFQSAADAAQRGLDSTPDNVWLLNGLGVSLQAMGQDDKAKEVLAQASDISKSMTAEDWKRAYPGNDAEVAQWDLAQFKTDVNYNLQLAANPFLAGKGKFQAACAASQKNTCQGNRCAPVNCDAGHPGLTSGNDPTTGLAYCDEFPSCAGDCDCGDAWPVDQPCWPTSLPLQAWQTWKPKAIYADPGCGKKANRINSNDNIGCTASGAGPGDCCYYQRSVCGKSARSRSTQVCAAPPVNNPPTVTINAPKSPGLDPGNLTFSWNFTNPDTGDTQSRYVINITCSSSGTRHIDQSSVSTSQSVSGFVFGDSCSWTIIAYDSKSPAAASPSVGASFSIKNAPIPPSCPNGTCGVGEDCNSCPADCGVCPPPPPPPSCPNGTCGSGENCDNCPADCGVCLPSCSCGSTNGGVICGDQSPADSALCSSNNVDNQHSGYPYGTWTWDCSGGGCTTVSCSAQGRRFCGWVEVNP